MSSNITDPSNQTAATAQHEEIADKGKGKATNTEDESMEEDDEDDDDEDEEEGEDSSDEEVDDSLEEIDPSAILPTGRRTRGVKVDYTSEAALAKAGLKQGEGEEDDDEDTKMKD